MEPELAGRVALVTGVSRRAGIGWSVATRLHRLGATVVASGWPAHDREMPWGGDGIDDAPFVIGVHDLGDPAAPGALIDETVEAHGRVDVVVAAHARSSAVGLDDVTAAELDRCWAVNVRSIVLLAQRMAAVGGGHADPPHGRLIWFTSGQHLGPMDGEIAYAVSKGALHQMTMSVDHALSGAGIIANCINPGPVDTGYATVSTRDAVAPRFPSGRWTEPGEIAELVAFLVSDRGAVVRGQVIDAEAGFRR